MTYFEVLFVGWACLGDSRVPVLGSIRPIPEAARPALAAFRLSTGGPACRPVPQIERFPVKIEAERRIVALGQGAAPRLRWCQRFRCFERSIVWTDRLVIDGREIKP